MEREPGMQINQQKDSYSTDRRVIVAGFGTAAVLLCLFLLLMSWLAEQVHLAQFCLSRFGH
jgi:predicted tellurium resistance membrane protein TerC